MRFQCPFCSFMLKDIAPSLMGEKLNCPNCNHQTFIPTDPFAPGRIIGDFLIKEKIGEGSIGAVYFAQQMSLDRNVALKILSKKYTTAKGMASFLAEARAAAKLSHPNLVQALSVGEEEDGTCYMAMTYVRGETVKTKIKREKKIAVDEALHIIQQVAEALHYAWEDSKLIHRDVKPENIMLDEDGVAKLTDLGLAMHQADWYKGMEISGSPSYMSPEQFIGDKLDTRSDVYSLGISLYQMLTGKLPFDASTLNSMAKQHFYQKPAPLNKADPFIPAKVSLLVKKMIEKHPDSRFQNMDELLRQLWEVRQITAPSKDLVPDVHTVSIKRLDYTLQTETKEKKQQLKIEEGEQKKKSAIMLSVLAYSIPVILLVVIIISGISYSNSKALREKAKLVDDFDVVMKASANYSLEDLEKKCEEITAYLGTPGNEPEKMLVLRMAYHKLNVENMKLVKEGKRYMIASQGSIKEKDKGQKKIEDLIHERDELKNELARKLEELKAKENYINKMGDNASILRERNKYKKENEDLKAHVEKISKDYEDSWKDDIRLKLFSMVSQARFPEAIEMMHRLSPAKAESQRPWFTLKIARLELMDKAYPILTSSGTKHAGLQLDEGKLLKISNGEIELLDQNNNLVLKRWNVLSINSLCNIVKSELGDVDENFIKADIALLAGRPGEARKIQMDDAEIRDICDAVYKNTLENIRYLAPSDKKKAISKAQLFYKEFSAVPGFEKCKDDLEGILGKDFLLEEDPKKISSSNIIHQPTTTSPAQ